MTVSVKEKRAFLKWLLNNYTLKQREAVWILNYVASEDKLMDRIHFVENAKFANHGVIMSTTCDKETPFAFCEENIMSTDAEKSFHKIRSIRHHTDDKIYIQINFKNKLQTHQYLAVLEENPYFKNDIPSIEIMQDANKFIEEMEKNNVKHLIDLALDAKDQERFNYLVGGLNK